MEWHLLFGLPDNLPDYFGSSIPLKRSLFPIRRWNGAVRLHLWHLGHVIIFCVVIRLPYPWPYSWSTSLNPVLCFVVLYWFSGKMCMLFTKFGGNSWQIKLSAPIFSCFFPSVFLSSVSMSTPSCYRSWKPKHDAFPLESLWSSSLRKQASVQISHTTLSLWITKPRRPAP